MEIFSCQTAYWFATGITADGQQHTRYVEVQGAGGGLFSVRFPPPAALHAVAMRAFRKETGAMMMSLVPVVDRPSTAKVLPVLWAEMDRQP
jgi:hypothetical protein